MFKILSTYICWKNMYKMQHLEGSGTPVLCIGRTVFKCWTVPDTSLHETSDLIKATEGFVVETTLMLKAVKIHYNKEKKHCDNPNLFYTTNIRLS
jgi:hypothetical protein